jgi:hypothetical protein
MKRDGVAAISFHCVLKFLFQKGNSLMKHLLILFLMLLPASELLAGQAEATPRRLAASQTASAPETVVKNFYRWYIDRLNQNRDPLTQEKTALRKYITPEFMRKAPKLLEQSNADVFICAQDWDKDWGRNVSVSRLDIQGTTATITIALSGKMMNHKLKVKLKQISSVWKIERIEPLDP